MVVLVLGFGQMFYTILACNEGQCLQAQTEGDDFAPFEDFSKAIIYSYSIILGQIDLGIFDTAFTASLWFLYTFFVVIVVLNFLVSCFFIVPLLTLLSRICLGSRLLGSLGILFFRSSLLYSF